MSDATDKPRRALGKGLSSLLPGRASGVSAMPVGTSAAAAQMSEHPPVRLPIASIDPNPLQPRIAFQADKLAELAQSVRANGIIQPLIVRKRDGRYQLVAGERRWRAAKLAELSEVPVVVQDVADSQMLELALIENIQREDLNPIETAQAYDRLGRELGLSHDELGRRTGKDRTTVANILRLLKLPQDVQTLLADRRISMGHARAVLGLPDPAQQIEIAEKAAAQGLSVRQVEALIQERTSERQGEAKGRRKDRNSDPNVRAAVDELERALGTRVRIVELSDERGRIEIEYYSQAELDRLYRHIKGD